MPAKSKRKPVPSLTLHRQTGQWSKCFSLPNGRRKTVYFGTDPDAAMAKYLAEREEWQAGRNPREGAVLQRASAVSLADLVNAFLDRTASRVQSGELAALTLHGYVEVGKAIAEHLGRNRDVASLGPADFASFRNAMAKRYAPSRFSKTIVVARMMFRWGFESQTIEAMPRFGPDFKVAGKRAARSAKAAGGAKLLTADDIKAVLAKSPPTLAAMVLLGINAGLGNADVANLPLPALDLDNGWLNFPRPKTGVGRRVPLWPETVAALRKVLAGRNPKPGSEHLVFLTARGSSWVRVRHDGRHADSIIPRFRKACIAAGVHKPRMGFYWLRHTLQTIGDEARDPLATAHLMGHADGTIGGHYREGISDERLRRVTDHVRQWLLSETAETPKVTGKPSLRVVG